MNATRSAGERKRPRLQFLAPSPEMGWSGHETWVSVGTTYVLFPHRPRRGLRGPHARAYEYLIENPGGIDSQGRCVATLALISSDDPKVFKAGKRMALDWNKPYNDETWSWHLGFQGITLAEYHLLTGDQSVRKTLKSTMDAAYKDMPDGHADALMGLTWGWAGVFASDDKKLKQKIANYYKAWINLARCHGSDSYVILPARDYADLAYYPRHIVGWMSTLLPSSAFSSPTDRFGLFT